tara:strand:- start:5908 stop:6795 length:888 start_codon:yes stop_codon:yes gene_type:complete
MLRLSILFLLSCSSDIAIITTQDKNQDTFEDQLLNNSSDEPANEPAGEPDSQMTDLTIGFAELSLMQIACPACMGVTNEFDIIANLKLHEPTTGGYSSELTPVGTCQTQQFGSYVSSTPLSISGVAFFESIQLYPAAQSEWTATNLQEYQIPRRESVNITVDAGSIANAFETLEGFDDIQPWELRYVDPSYAFAAVISKQGTTFTWYPIISDSQFEVLIVVYTPDGSQILGLTTCMENDVGYLSIPGSYFVAYPYYSLAAVYLTRHRIDRRPAPEFNGWIESHQTWTVLGTAHIE